MYDPRRHHRQSVRLREVSYAEAGGYFVTVCTAGRVCLFGEVVEGEMRLNEVGRVVEGCWVEIPAHFPHVVVDAFVVMPNHVHGVIGIVDEAEAGGNAGRGAGNGTGMDRGAGMGRGAACCAPTTGGVPVRTNVEAGSLGAIVRSFKSAVTRRVNGLYGWSGTSVWQRNYYESVIRGERHLEAVRAYIRRNPGRWGEDEYFVGGKR